MTGPAPAEAPLRKAALTLHALAAGDRDWVLHALPSAHRELLQPLLRELHELGIARDSLLVAELAPQAPAPLADPADAGWLDRLDADGLLALARVLEAEAPQLTAALLSCRAGSWQGRLLHALQDETRQALPASQGTCAAAPRLRRTILDALQSRVRAAAPRAKVPTGPWDRIRATLRSLGRLS